MDQQEQQAPAKPKPSVMFATPTYDGKVNVRYVMGLMGSMFALRAFGHKTTCAFDANLVERSRAILAKALIESKMDYMFFIDSDIAFEPAAAVAVVAKATELDVSILAVPYPRRNCIPIDFPIRPPEEREEVVLEDNGLYRSGGAPTGFMLIHRRVIEAVTKSVGRVIENDVPYIFEPMWIDDGKRLLSEDLAFCRRAEDLGYPTYLLPGVRLIHEGQFGYGGTWPPSPEDMARQARFHDYLEATRKT